MDADTLKIVLDLQKENLQLNDAIDYAIMALLFGKRLTPPAPGCPYFRNIKADSLIHCVYSHLERLNNQTSPTTTQ